MMRKVAFVTAILAIMFMTVGCASFSKNAYSSIDTVRITVDAAMKTAGDLHRRGIIGDEEKAQILDIHAKYRAIHQTACEFLKMYKELEDKEAKEGVKLQIQDAIQALLSLSVELTGIVNEYLSRDSSASIRYKEDIARMGRELDTHRILALKI